jgi:hypothetical protein
MKKNKYFEEKIESHFSAAAAVERDKAFNLIKTIETKSDIVDLFSTHSQLIPFPIIINRLTLPSINTTE